MLRSPLLQSMVGLTICDQHQEKEEFYCEEDQRPLCNFCVLAPEHKDHQVLPLDTAADKCKDKLQKILTALQKKEEEIKMALYEVSIRETHFQEDASIFKKSMISEYEKMHYFIFEKECLYLQVIDLETTKNLDKLKDNESKLRQKTQTLQGMIVDIEENLDKVPLEMLQNMKGILERNKEVMLQKPYISSPAWSMCPITGLREMLMTFQRDITLDPATANPHLILSEDLKRVQYGSVPQDLPDNKERFDVALVVLGAQTFTSGKHYWEVEMQEKTEWELGICKDSIRRKGKLYTSSEEIKTIAGFTSGNCFIPLNSEKSFHFSTSIPKVGIFLDYEMGHIAFYDVTDRCLIHNFPSTTFEGPFRPYFSPYLPKEERTSGSLLICSRSSH